MVLEALTEINSYPVDNVTIGRRSIERISLRLGGEMPYVRQIRALRPPMECFIDPKVALDPKNPHSIAHIGEVLVVGIPFIDLRQARSPEVKLYPHVILEALRYHDCRVSDWESYPDHGLHAAQWLRRHGKKEEMGGYWLALQFLLIHHSDPPGKQLPNKTPIFLQAMLETMQDIDAAAIVRSGTTVTNLSEIQFRTPEARIYNLPEIYLALRERAELLPSTGDIFEDQIQAGLSLGLVRPDPKIL